MEELTNQNDHPPRNSDLCKGPSYPQLLLGGTSVNPGQLETGPWGAGTPKKTFQNYGILTYSDIWYWHVGHAVYPNLGKWWQRVPPSIELHGHFMKMMSCHPRAQQDSWTISIIKGSVSIILILVNTWEIAIFSQIIPTIWQFSWL